MTLSTPDSDRYSFTARTWSQIKVALGGRVAEKVVFGEITTGAESDIQNLTQVARGMVGRSGMSDAIGPIAVIPRRLRRHCSPAPIEPSEATQQLVDNEVRRIVETARSEVSDLLEADNLDALVAGFVRARDARRGRRVRCGGPAALACRGARGRGGLAPDRTTAQVGAAPATAPGPNAPVGVAAALQPPDAAGARHALRRTHHVVRTFSLHPLAEGQATATSISPRNRTSSTS